MFKRAVRSLLVAGLAVATATALWLSSPGTPTVEAAGTQHYEYVFPDGAMDVYDMDNGMALVKQVSLPTQAGVRGVDVDPGHHALFVSYGGDGGGFGNGSLLKFDLLSNSVVWTKSYGHGIDSFAMNAAGTRIYMPDGELTSNGLWYVVDAATGNELGSIGGGSGPHNTVVGLTTGHVYLGGRFYNYLDVADPNTNTVIRRLGPLVNTVRPFTVNGRETLAFTTATGFLGFQVSSISSGQVLYTAPVAGFPCCGAASAPSHGISLSPDEREIYLVDSVSSYAHVFDVSGLPGAGPRKVADIRLAHSMSGNESGCAYDCLKDGWIQHSRDGRFVFVGDSGDVISTASRSVVGYLPALANTRKMLEVDWSNGVPVSTTTRTGLGYVFGAAPPPPTATPTPPIATPTPTPSSSASSTARGTASASGSPHGTAGGSKTKSSGSSSGSGGSTATGPSAAGGGGSNSGSTTADSAVPTAGKPLSAIVAIGAIFAVLVAAVAGLVALRRNIFRKLRS